MLLLWLMVCVWVMWLLSCRCLVWLCNGIWGWVVVCDSGVLVWWVCWDFCVGLCFLMWLWVLCSGSLFVWVMVWCGCVVWLWWFWCCVWWVYGLVCGDMYGLFRLCCRWVWCVVGRWWIWKKRKNKVLKLLNGLDVC